MNDLVSIIIPVYNCGKFIDKTIQSIANQTYKNIELILIDDGSTDNSLEICKNAVKGIESNIIIHQENFGAPSARNRGIDVANGKYIIFFDSDDILAPSAIEVMMREFENKNTDLVIGKTRKIDEEGNVIGEKNNTPALDLKISDQLFMLDPFPGNKIYKSNIIKDNKIRFGNVRIGQDLNFYLKYCAFVKEYSLIDKYVSSYRIVSSGISRTYNFKIFDIVESYNDIEKFYKNNGLLSDSMIKILDSSKCFHYYSQLKKVIYFKTRRERKIIRKYFLYYLDYPLKNNLVNKKDLSKLKFKIFYYRLVSSVKR